MTSSREGAQQRGSASGYKRGMIPCVLTATDLLSMCNGARLSGTGASPASVDVGVSCRRRTLVLSAGEHPIVLGGARRFRGWLFVELSPTRRLKRWTAWRRRSIQVKAAGQAARRSYTRVYGTGP